MGWMMIVSGPAIVTQQQEGGRVGLDVLIPREVQDQDQDPD